MSEIDILSVHAISEIHDEGVLIIKVKDVRVALIRSEYELLH